MNTNISTGHDIALNGAMVFELELKNGKKSVMTTFFHQSDVDFEEVVVGTQKAFSKCRKIKSVKTTVGNISSGKFKGVFFYDTKEF